MGTDSEGGSSGSRPAASPNRPSLTFPSRSHTRAVAAIGSALRAGASAVVVTGASGVGKTTLCRELATLGDERTFSTAVLDPRLRADEILSQLLREFGLINDQAPASAVHDREKLAAAAARFLASLKPLGAQVVVVVDDAERMDAAVLRTLMDLSTSADPDGRLLRLVLVGQGSLNHRFDEPTLESLSARIGAYIQLEPLERDEILPYVADRMTTTPSGAQALSNLTPELLDEIYGQSEGIPSRVNFFVARARQAEASEAVEYAAPVERAVEAKSTITERVRRPPGWIGGLVALLALVVVLGWWWTRSPVRTRAADTAPPSAPVAPATATAQNPVTPAPSPPPAVVEAPAVAEPPVTDPAAAVVPVRVTVASFRTSGRAEQIAAQLRDRQIPVTIRVDRSGTWHQIVAGPYPSLDAARQAQETLAQAGFPETQIAAPPVNPPSPEPVR